MDIKPHSSNSDVSLGAIWIWTIFGATVAITLLMYGSYLGSLKLAPNLIDSLCASCTLKSGQLVNVVKEASIAHKAAFCAIGFFVSILIGMFALMFATPSRRD
jgi:hypothetical protein